MGTCDKVGTFICKVKLIVVLDAVGTLVDNLSNQLSDTSTHE